MIWIKFSTQVFTSFYSVCLFKWNGGSEVLYICTGLGTPYRHSIKDHCGALNAREAREQSHIGKKIYPSEKIW